jgi:GDP-6-deoxy-D-talose 4-dehydrogenase
MQTCAATKLVFRFSMSKILISGADSFTGRYLAASLHQAGHEVHGLIREPIVGSIAGVQAMHVVDLADAAGLATVVRNVQPHKVAHLAAISFVAHGDPAAIYNTNVVGTRNLLEALVQSQAPLDVVLLASSANVYGNAIEGVLDENTPFAPANDYAVSKVAMEYVAQLYSQRLPIVITRPFNYTGVGQSPSFLLPKIVSHFQQRASILELGNLDVVRDFSDVRTVAERYKLLLEAAPIGDVFNVCSGVGHSLMDVVQMARDLTSHSLEVRVNPAFVRANEVRQLIGSSAKLDHAVGKPSDIALKDTLQWMLSSTH